MGLVFIPLYLHFLGIEAYGLVGIFATMQAMFGLLDMGLGATLNRELARLSVQPDQAQQMRNLLRTLEIIYWAVAVIIGVVVIFLAPFLAHHWVQPEHLSPAAIQQAFLLMGLSLAGQWPLSFYSGGLKGLQRQVLLNVIDVSAATLRGIGAVLLLWLVSPTIQAFFIWQAVIGAVQTMVVCHCLWRSLPPGDSPSRFQRQLLTEIWRFAAGMSGISLTVLILTNLDKIILSRMLTLEMFGYYTLAWVAASSLYRLINPFSNAIYPRLTQLVTQDRQAELSPLYHRSCQLMSVAVLPCALMMIFFSYEIMLFWTKNAVTAKETHIILSILATGIALHSLMHIPYCLQLASGWTSLAFYTNVAAVAILAPAIIIITPYYGAVGAATIWVILNSGYVLISMQIMHRRLLPKEKWRWYCEDVGLPLGGALVCASLGKALLNSSSSISYSFLMLACCSLATFLGAALSCRFTRNLFLTRLKYLCLYISNWRLNHG